MPLMKVLLKETKMVNIQKRTLFATATVLAVIALIAIISVPSILAQSNYNYALNPQNWAGVDEPAGKSTIALTTDLTIRIDAKGYAFQRVSEDTIKQYNCTTEIVVQVTPATDASNRTVNVTGTITVNGTTYTINDGKAFLSRDNRLFYLNCTGTDGSGNAIILKFGGHYFWWGGKAYALRIKGLLQTDDGQVLLLQRGIARID
jgi:hypothetical protein